MQCNNNYGWKSILVYIHIAMRVRGLQHYMHAATIHRAIPNMFRLSRKADFVKTIKSVLNTLVRKPIYCNCKFYSENLCC